MTYLHTTDSAGTAGWTQSGIAVAGGGIGGGGSAVSGSTGSSNGGTTWNYGGAIYNGLGSSTHLSAFVSPLS